MRRLIIIAVISALVLAKPKPETYKETEDFQYSRSSSDDGTKSGFYGAQRGNMGGNYERAHNMDTLAQHQMSGLVRQVDGELGDGAKTRTGSVFTAANSRGIYGSGSYDLSNLSGRNFAEGESSTGSQAHSTSASQNSRYRGQSYNGVSSNSGFSSSHAQHSSHSGYQTSSHADQSQIDNLQAVDTSQGLGRYESGNQAGYNTKYHTQYGSLGRSNFDQSSANLYSSSGHDANSQAQYITTPVKVVLRPGGRVAIPIAAPTYSVSQNALSENKNSLNTDAELLNQQSVLTPTNKVKQYESSYSYRKQWEKHHEVPGYVSVAVPTENSYPKNSELYEDAQSLSSKNQFQDSNSLLAQSSNTNNNYRGYVQSTGSSRSRLHASTQQGQSDLSSQQGQAGFNSQHSQSSLTPQHSNSGLTQSSSGAQQWHSDLSSQQSHLGFNEQQSAALSASSTLSRANAYGRNAQASGIGTGSTNTIEDINLKPKSYQSSYSYHKSWERQGDPYVIIPAGGTNGAQTSEKLTAASANSGAYSYSQHGSHSRQAHQSYSADCDDEGHRRIARSPDTYEQLVQGQNQWDDLGQQTQSQWENLEDLGQQQQSKWDNLQELGQQTQSQWDNLQQLGQETQNNWDNLQQLGQQTQDKWDNLEDLGQQTHRDRKQNENLEDFGQHMQNGEMSTNLEQQANSQKENLDISSKHNQKEEAVTNFEQQADSESENRDIFEQNIPKENKLTNFEQQANVEQSETWDNFNQQNQKEDSLVNFEQQANSQNEHLDIFSQHSQKEDELTTFEKKDILNQKSQTEDSLTESEHASNQKEHWDIFNQQSQHEGSVPNFEQQANNQQEDLDIFSQHSQKEEALSNFEQQANGEKLYIQTNKDQQENPSSFNWNQMSVFQVPANVDFINQHIQSANKLNNDGSKIVQNQQTEWFHPVIQGLDTEKNTDDFIKPNSPWKIDNDKSTQEHVTDKSVTVNDKRNLFTLPPTNNKIWPLNTEQDVFSNTYGHFEQSVWNLNNFDISEQKFENSFAHDTSGSSHNGNPLHSLWDKIDNIAGEITVNEGKPEDKQIILHDYSNFQHQNVNHMQHGFSWTNMPVKPYIEIPNTKNYTEVEDKNSGSKSLFDEPTESSSTLVPKWSTQHSTTPVPDVPKPNNNNNVEHPKVHLEDVGRGDIEPEETIFEETSEGETHKSPQEIETTNLIKEPKIPISHPIVLKDNDEYRGNGSSDLNSNPQISTNKPSAQPIITTTIPTVTISTTMKINTNVDSSQQVNQPILDVLSLNKNPSPDLQKQIPYQPTVESDIPFQTNDQQHIYYDQQNVDQMFEDYQQSNNMQDQSSLQDLWQQLQSPSLSISDFQSKDVNWNLQQVQDKQTLSPTSSYKQNPQVSTNSKDSQVQTQEVIEPLQISHNIDSSSNKQIQNNEKLEDLKSEDVPSPIEATTENPGFWNKVGNKLSNAKNKVFSWFKSS